MTTNNNIHFALTYFNKSNEIDMATYPIEDDGLNRVTDAIQLLESKGLADVKRGEFGFHPLSATLNKAGQARRNKELKVNL